jgi:hypothetical protein
MLSEKLASKIPISEQDIMHYNNKEKSTGQRRPYYHYYYRYQCSICKSLITTRKQLALHKNSHRI